ncbi:MAG: CDP-2,3-bis-(O-geranylgeranyl)-sn-glycerol synthase [Candidatus Bathyarchaeota archaeon]|nr:CDP-2,3-bis-(O-geranylgeranyl)-sn-glycerol synthase [Candidatus Bathyarchaeota archaeon]
MEIALLVVEALKFIFPAYCANAAPVLGGGGKPMDFDRDFFDDKRIFGAHKTFRGFFVGLAIGTIVGVIDCLVFGFPWLFAVLTPLGALIGDLVGAFLKRRLNLAPGALLPVVDQIDFVVGALVFALPIMVISWQLAVTVLLITPPIHLSTNFVAYKLKLKKNPW